ncbi:FAST kinase domain-containing protein 4 isoform X1 [Bombus affinis]|uniref:FAST kinase domain-containing protein 4 isoform X1 n=1 Tax=Bombus affinis TaxID=309941 RepID=UPI0021B77F1F|nr:FAST kinase domain-containing protein 4 isoform X1 [Bombus affinis]
MLQFNTAVFTIATRFTSRFLWRLNASLSTNTAAVVSESKTAVKPDDQIKEMISNIKIDDKQDLTFDELKIKLCKNLNIKPIITKKFQKAQTIQEILEAVKTSFMSHDDILYILKTISIWVNDNKKSNSSTEINESSAQKQTKVNNTTSENFLNNTEDYISQYYDLSTSAMIKNVNQLAQAGDRNVKLLNYFFTTITEYHELLNTKACSNLMFNMSSLNYSDERLLKKICKDFIKSKNISGTTSVQTVISLLKSMAFIRYKNNVFLNQICEDIVKSKIKYSDTQITNILQSFASLGYHSQYVNDIIKEYIPNMKIEKFEYLTKLNLVWCFAVFKTLQNMHAETVLDDKFISEILFFDEEKNKKLSAQLKLLNINGYAQYALEDYSGPFLNNNIVPHVVNKRSKQKTAYVEALRVTLKNMLPSMSYCNMDINTNMGFLLDAEVCMDHNCNFVSVNSTNNNSINFTKIALLLVDYYDMCLGDTDYQGLIKLYSHLLECRNYKVLIIPYQHFGIEDKTEKRISYLRHQLLRIIRQKPDNN